MPERSDLVPTQLIKNGDPLTASPPPKWWCAPTSFRGVKTAFFPGSLMHYRDNGVRGMAFRSTQ